VPGATARKPAPALTAGGIRVELTHPDKVLFPGDGITKADLAGYYRDVAGLMLPWMRGRPVSMARFPDGITGERIFQKNVPGYFPDWITRVEVPKQGGVLHHVVADKPATLIYLANQACIEPHLFLSQDGDLDRPDQIVFDLDPPGAGQFAETRAAALALRGLLEDELGLTVFVKTTGGKGLHVHLNLAGPASFDDTRAFAREASALLARRQPGLLTLEQRKDQRGRLVYSDVMRNAYAQTVIAPFAVRARPGAPAAVPLSWDEVADGELTPGDFTLRTVRDRLERLSGQGPWEGMGRHRYRLARAASRMARLTAE
jgi:bifunctional non-homologous end joining protein LigD